MASETDLEEGASFQKGRVLGVCASEAEESAGGRH